MIGRVDIDNGTPVHEGLYAVETNIGWRLLEWHRGGWWHMERVGNWPNMVPAQWVGPLPAKRPVNKPAPTFDL